MPFYLFVIPIRQMKEIPLNFSASPPLELDFLRFGRCGSKGPAGLSPPDRPSASIRKFFWNFRGMVARGVIFIALSLWATWQRKKEEQTKKTLAPEMPGLECAPALYCPDARLGCRRNRQAAVDCL